MKQCDFVWVETYPARLMSVGRMSEGIGGIRRAEDVEAEQEAVGRRCSCRRQQLAEPSEKLGVEARTRDIRRLDIPMAL